MFKALSRTAAAALLATLPFGANALGISITTFGNNLAGAQADFNNTLGTFDIFSVVEDFEEIALGQISGSLNTGTIGSFTTAGGIGSGNSQIDDGTNLAVRDENIGNTGGRINTSDGVGDTQYLDSNDTRGMIWTASDQAGGQEFDRLLFTLTDPADTGQTLTISSTDENGDEVTFVETIAPPQANGGIFNILISFSDTVAAATVTLEKSDVNDGFSIDNAAIGAVPLPAAAWLLLGVSGALVLGKRRSARRAA